MQRSTYKAQSASKQAEEREEAATQQPWIVFIFPLLQEEGGAGAASQHGPAIRFMGLNIVFGQRQECGRFLSTAASVQFQHSRGR
ncbi:hypothetical protein EYF80_000816 [Liparis tanakae]|uniref:Uncharacterized protein n=1 Tax=Liparis tanakae TaxID=230148 RepID=A0A4Z2JH04_9TELE|nr:hypothetical protein EYF80_000816 [Liparis tanakae]